MTKQDFLAMSLLYDKKFTSTLDDVHGMPASNKIWTCNGIIPIFGDLCLNTLESSDAYPIQSVKPIIRHISTLTEPITHKGETFVPIVELAKIASNDDNWVLEEGYAIKILCGKDTFYLFEFYNAINCFKYELYSESECIVPDKKCNQLQLFLKLIEWGYWPNMPEGEEVVYVTDEFNPYK